MWSHPLVVTLFSIVATAVVTALIYLGTFLFSWGKVREELDTFRRQWDEWKQVDAAHWASFKEEANRRWTRIENRVGISDWNTSPFVDRKDLARLEIAISDGVTAMAEGRRDRAELRERLVHVETLTEQLCKLLPNNG